METIRIMSVGRPGVGKSTIGNMFLHGNYKGTFKRSTGSTFCTDMPIRQKSETRGVEYIDVPGIPCTDPKNTAKFYDIVISEANKGVDVFLFVFKRDKEDPEAYKTARVVFREVSKGSAVKILVINDFNNYDFDDPPTEADFEGQMERIATLTKIDFTHRITFNSRTMPTKVNKVKGMVSKQTEREYEHLRNFSEQATDVKELQESSLHCLNEIRVEKQRSRYYQTVIPILKYATILFGWVSWLSATFALETVGAARPITVLSFALMSGCCASLHTEQITNLSKTEDKITDLKQKSQVIKNDFQRANEEFEELKKVLESSYV